MAYTLIFEPDVIGGEEKDLLQVAVLVAVPGRRSKPDAGSSESGTGRDVICLLRTADGNTSPEPGSQRPRGECM